MTDHKTWHEEHHESLTFGNHLADTVAKGMGSWRFISAQTILVIFWMGLNVIGVMYHWDVYPFILLNLLFSTQAAYAAPIIMIAQNRQSDRDRMQALADYKTNKEAKLEIEALAIMLKKIEVDKLDKLIKMLEDMKKAGGEIIKYLTINRFYSNADVYFNFVCKTIIGKIYGITIFHLIARFPKRGFNINGREDRYMVC